MEHEVSRILVTGSREWTDIDLIHRIIRDHYRFYPDAVLVHGNARGADKMAAEEWERLGGTTEPHLADWNRLGKAAGFIRNGEMVRSGIDLCLAFVKGKSRGASITVDLCLAEKVHTKIWRQ